MLSRILLQDRHVFASIQYPSFTPFTYSYFSPAWMTSTLAAAMLLARFAYAHTVRLEGIGVVASV